MTDNSAGWLTHNVDEIGALVLIGSTIALTAYYNAIGAPHAAFDEAVIYAFYMAIAYLFAKRGLQAGLQAYEKR